MHACLLRPNTSHSGSTTMKTFPMRRNLLLAAVFPLLMTTLLSVGGISATTRQLSAAHEAAPDEWELDALVCNLRSAVVLLDTPAESPPGVVYTGSLTVVIYSVHYCPACCC